MIVSVDSHFARKAAWLREAFDEILARLEPYGQLRVDAVKGSVNLAGRAHFAGVYVGKRAISVEFVLRRRVSDIRIRRSSDSGVGWFGHTVKLSRAEELDDQLIGWLAEALAARS